MYVMQCPNAMYIILQTLIASILEMLGQEAVRKLSRVFRECCAVLQKQCQQSMQENKSLRKTIGKLERNQRAVDSNNKKRPKGPLDTGHTRSTGMPSSFRVLMKSYKFQATDGPNVEGGGECFIYLDSKSYLREVGS